MQGWPRGWGGPQRAPRVARSGNREHAPFLTQGVGKAGVSRRGDRRVLIEVKEPG